jgi:membrane protease YdiL (CAAX protease family)
MIGILVQLLISWFLIWLFEKQDLRVLGLKPTRQRAADFILFFLLTALCCASGFFMRMYFGERWIINPVFTWSLLGEGLLWHIKSVLYEELIFRGVILYILIKRLGPLKAIIISAIAFGIYHWFSHEVIGNPKAMIITFFLTGTMGLLYAFGYAKTFSLYIPCAIHLGWNFTQGFIFPQGLIGNGILIAAKPERIVTVSYFTFYTVTFLPMISALLINFLLLKRRRQVEPPGQHARKGFEISSNPDN